LKDIGEIATLILRRFEEERFLAPGVTKFIKLLYLYEVEYCRREQKKPTELKWFFLHFGPYSPALADELRKKGFFFEEEEIERGTFKKARPSTYYEDAQLNTLDLTDEIILYQLVKRWGDEDLKKILDYVYYETEPMEEATRGSVLDFTKINPPIPRTKIKAHIPDKELRPLRYRLDQRFAALAEDRKHIECPITPESFYPPYLTEPLTLPKKLKVKFRIK